MMIPTKKRVTMIGSLDDFDDYYKDENYDDDGEDGLVYNV